MCVHATPREASLLVKRVRRTSVLLIIRRSCGAAKTVMDDPRSTALLHLLDHQPLISSFVSSTAGVSASSGQDSGQEGLDSCN